MEIKLLDLKEKILSNIDYLITQYSATDILLNEIDRLLNKNTDENTLLQWWNENRYHIEVINEILERM